MNKTIKIVLYVAFLLFAYFTVTAIYKSCNASSTDTSLEEDISSDDEDEFFKDFDSEEDEQSIATDDNNEKVDDDDDDVEVGEEEIDYKELDDILEGNEEESEYTKPKSKPVKPKKKKVKKPSKKIKKQVKNYTTNNSSYMIVAGNFLVEANAYKLVNKLKKLGYPNAEVSVFDESKYHTVIAMRTNNRSKANSNVAILKNKDVDCYVHRRYE